MTKQKISLENKIQFLNQTTKKIWGKPARRYKSKTIHNDKIQTNEIEQLRTERNQDSKINNTFLNQTTNKKKSPSHPKDVQAVSFPGNQEQTSNQVHNFFLQPNATLLEY